jgi:hypothetical protein
MLHIISISGSNVVLQISTRQGSMFEESDRLKFERQKLATELLLKRQELALKRQEVAELAKQRGKSWKEIFANPVTLAIVGGFVTLMTTIISNYFTTRSNIESESFRAQLAEKAERGKAELADKAASKALQADLIKKYSESTNTVVVRENLRFLVEAGLLPEYQANIQSYLDKNRYSAPSSVAGRASQEPFVDLTFFLAGMRISTDGICSVACPSDPFHQNLTSLRDPETGKALDPTQIPYIALPFGKTRDNQIALGDFAAVYNTRTKKMAFAVFADFGPAVKLGEGSIALARALDIPVTPLDGVADGIVYVVFPKSAVNKHLTGDLIDAEGKKQFEQWGGEKELQRRLKSGG